MVGRIAIIGIVGVPPRYGGFETLADQLIDSLSFQFEFTVYCSGSGMKTKNSLYKGARLRYVPIRANGLASVLYDGISILDAVKRSLPTLLVLGVSGAITFPLVRFLAPKTRIVVNVDGIEWKREKWGVLARVFLRFCERIAVKYSTMVIADNQGIVDHVRKQYGKRAELISYGGDHVKPRSKPLHTRLGLPATDYLCAVCRIEPENNVEMILQAYKQTKTDRPLVFVGNWNNSVFGKRLRSEYASSRCLLIDPIYDGPMIDSIRTFAALYIHGHSAGGTNPSLVEAMYFNKPIVAFDVCYNRHTLGLSGTFFESATELARIIDNFGKSTWIENVGVLKTKAERCYSWEHISAQYAKLLR